MTTETEKIAGAGAAAGDFAAIVRDAIGDANVPTLLMVLVQLTGDLAWLEEPYRPARGKGLSENDTGGLPEEIQDEVRAAAADAIIAWHAGTPVAIDEPDEELYRRMLQVAIGEPVPDEYGPMIADDMNALGGDPAWLKAVPAAPEGFSALVIGAGISGMLAAHDLRKAGVETVVVERGEQLGGTWWHNRYPGCGVDVPSHLYQFAAAASDWPYYYATRDELHDYLQKVGEDWDIASCTRFGTTVRAARWDSAAQLWRATVVGPDGAEEELSANILISAVGAFGNPKFPNIPGRDAFAGETVHTSLWDADFDVAGKRVAVIGNGASAMQIVPSIAPEVVSLTVFQRSAHWVAPFEKFRTPVPDPVRFLLREVPLYRAWYRQRLAWVLNDTLFSALQVDPEWPHQDRSINAANDGHRRFFTRYIESELAGRDDLIAKVVPDYPPFGKRILLDNGWYRTLRRDDVELVSEAITEIVPEGIVTADGRVHEVDVIVYATGFDVVNFLSSFELTGRSGRTLKEIWGADDADAYLGTTVPDFPNVFCLYGPNTQAGHGGSLIYYLECQMRYTMSLLGRMFARGATSVEVRPEVAQRYNDDVDAAHEHMIWRHPGFDTYYRNSRGRVLVANPWRVVDWWRMTRDADPAEYEFSTSEATVNA
ncbi:MAG: NAD(P)/FAD-dependent oxidoreductase [Gordonia sp. (in: high G+C Gram-positive bacteria)]|uniref:flavin-containing monooxygenase n=1 Tax=Gordonia sp. (in: high G+C Gram-positive bacteria) TaxID=84139 RepID=UPI0039E6733A